MLTPKERSLRARAAAYAQHAQGATSTQAGTAAFLNRFEREVDPDLTLPPEERARRAAFARKSYMTLLSLRASKGRRAATRALQQAQSRKKAAPAGEMPGAATPEVCNDRTAPTP